MLFGVTIEAEFTSLDEASLETFFDRLADELYDLDNDDLAVDANLATGTFQVSFIVEADDVGDAILKGLTFVRTGAHAAGAFTHTWQIDHLKANASKADAVLSEAC